MSLVHKTPTFDYNTEDVSVVLTIVTIAMRISVDIKLDGFGTGSYPQLLKTLDFVQVGILIFSTVTNILSTSVVGICVW